MRCRTCGCEVDDDKAFCPSCGATMKVTADYDYIQAEIANKVDKVFNEDENCEESGQKEGLDIPDLDQIIDADDAENEETENAEPKYEDSDDVNADDIQEEETEQSERKRRVKQTKKSVRSRRRSSDDEQEDSIFDHDNDDYDDEVDDIDDDYDDYDEDIEEETVRQPRRNSKPRDGRPSERNPKQRQSRQQSARGNRARTARKSYSYDREPGNQTSGKVFTILIIFVIIAATAIGVMYILGVFDGKSNQSGTSQVSETSTLTANIVNGSTYTAPYEIKISDALGGKIYYTLDGSEPTASSKAYTDTFSLTAADVQATYPNVTLRAAAFDKDGEKTGELSVSFQLEGTAAADGTNVSDAGAEAATVTAPQVTPASGEYTDDASIEVTAEGGATVYYTLDGTTPTENSTEYTGTIKMPPETSTFKAIAVKNGVTSDVTTCEYTLTVNYDVSPQQALTNVLMATDAILDNDLNTEDGYAKMQNIGVYEIDGYQYYIVRVDFYTTDGTLTSSQYDAVGVNYGGVAGATPSGNTFTVDE